MKIQPFNITFNLVPKFILGVLLTHCSAYQDKLLGTQSPNTEQQDILFQTQSAKQLSTEVLSTETANKYKVLLRWGSFGAQHIELRRWSQEGEHFIKLHAGQTQYIDDLVQPGVEYSYYIGIRDAGVFVGLVEATKIKVAKDLVLQGVNTLESLIAQGKATPNGELKEYRRIYFQDKAVLTSRDKSLSIHADEIYSDDALITGFQETDEAPLGKAGRQGGNISIVALKVLPLKLARGRLRIEARGERGGKGLAGKNGAPGPQGSLGQDAIEGTKYRGAKTGNDEGVQYCVRHATAGSGGGVGEVGSKGEQGYVGGNSGLLAVSISNTEQADILLDVIGGLGGRGGDGGKGGPGGVGAEGGQNHGTCGAGRAPRGPNANQAANGETGPDGISGKRLAVCQFGRCQMN